MESFDQNGPEDYFDKLSDDENDHMPGVEEAEEVKEKKKKVPAKTKKSVSTRVVLNERLLCGPKGLVKYLSHFQNMKLSQEKDSEYDNLKVIMSRLERWTHQLYPKWQMDTTLQKIENLGTKNLVKNNIKRIRTNEVSDDLDGMGLPEEVNRRGEADSQPSNPTEELFDQAFQDHRNSQPGEKRPSDSSTSEQPPAKKQITDEQRLRMEENKRRALEKKRQREEARLAEEARLQEEEELAMG